MMKSFSTRLCMYIFYISFCTHSNFIITCIWDLWTNSNILPNFSPSVLPTIGGFFHISIIYPSFSVLYSISLGDFFIFTFFTQYSPIFPLNIGGFLKIPNIPTNLCTGKENVRKLLLSTLLLTIFHSACRAHLTTSTIYPIPNSARDICVNDSFACSAFHISFWSTPVSCLVIYPSSIGV